MSIVSIETIKNLIKYNSFTSAYHSEGIGVVAVEDLLDDIEELNKTAWIPIENAKLVEGEMYLVFVDQRFDDVQGYVDFDIIFEGRFRDYLHGDIAYVMHIPMPELPK